MGESVAKTYLILILLNIKKLPLSLAFFTIAKELRTTQNQMKNVFL